jgi:hypothetical protein
MPTNRNILGIIVMLMAAYCIIALAWMAYGINIPSINYNEGWNAYHQTAAAINSHLLYPDKSSMMFNNYPPVSFLIVGTLGKLTGDMILTGRLVALIAFIVTAGCIYYSSRIMNTSKVEALFAATFFMIGIIAIKNSYARVDDPQMLGHAIGAIGLVIILASSRFAGVAAGIFVLAGFTKHNLVIQPVTVFLWLVLYDRKSAWQFAGIGLLLAAIGIATTDRVYNTNLIANLASPRLYSVHKMVALLSKWLTVWLVPLAAITARLYRQPHDKDVVFCAIYVAMGIAIGGAFTGGAGTGSSSLFDVLIALALSTAIALNRWDYLSASRRALFAVICVAPMVAAAMLRDATGSWFTADYWLHPLAAEQSSLTRDIAFIQAQSGSAVCEILSLCFLAGKPAVVDFFNLSQAIMAGQRSDTPLISEINAQQFAVIQVLSLDNNRETGDEKTLGGAGINRPFSMQVRDAMMTAYRIDHEDENGIFLVPR